MSQLSLFRCCKNSLPCLPPHTHDYDTDLQPEHLMSVFASDWEAHTTHRTLETLVLWKGDSEGCLLEGRQSSKRWTCTVLLDKWKPLNPDTFVPLPRSLILTHHLKKEVKAAIKSSHSVSQVACHMLDRAPSAVHLFFLLRHHGVRQ